MKGFFVALNCVLVAAAVQCKDVEAEFRRLPKLFHLDDYEKCMEKSDGIYCVGEFQIYSDIEDNPLYDLIQEKALDIRLYNRSLLHRGYCLPTRCPSGEANVTARFERCVDAYAKARSLRTRLRTLHYCRASNELLPYEANTSSTAHRVFLYFIYIILLINIIGTVYDFKFGKKGQKNPLLMAFSLRVNWLKLNAMADYGDPIVDNLQVIYGMRAIMIIGAIYAHVGVIVPKMYQHNPRFTEKYLSSLSGPLIGSLTTITHAYVGISNFLTTFKLLMMSKKHKIGLRMIPLIMLKRAIRIYPLYLLLNAYSATWWTSAGSGPMWPLLVGAESEICHKKFWITTLFLQNIIDSEHICLVQTWIVAIDMQVHLVSLIVVILLLKRREWVVPVLSLFFVGAIALTAYVAHTNKYIPAFYYMTPENFREMFVNEKNFTKFFMSPFNCSILSVAGVSMAFIYENHQRRGINIANSKILVLLHYFGIPTLLAWTYFCALLSEIVTDPTYMTLMITVERLAVTLICGFILYTMLNLKTPLESVFRWKSWRIFMRLSFAVSMVHWCVNMVLVANRQTLHHTSILGFAEDFLSTWAISHLIALPLTVMVEFPLQRFMDRLLLNMYM